MVLHTASCAVRVHVYVCGTYVNLIMIRFMKTKTITKKIKIHILKSNELSILLYAAESWKVTKGICHMLDVFQNKCLRRILLAKHSIQCGAP